MSFLKRNWFKVSILVVVIFFAGYVLMYMQNTNKLVEQGGKDIVTQKSESKKTEQPVTRNQTATINSVYQKPETLDDLFPMTNTKCDSSGCPQNEWYDRHNVAMASRCYPNSCDESQWRDAIYNGGIDTNAVSLFDRAQQQAEVDRAKFPKEKCVLDSGMALCDLSYNVISKKGNQRIIKIEGNEIGCIGPTTNYSYQVASNTAVITTGDMYCASDSGYVYIDPTLQVSKYFNHIKRDNTTSPYYITTKYSKCIWTYNDGNGSVPYIEILDNKGPSSGFNVKAFCSNGTNLVAIYSYKE